MTESVPIATGKSLGAALLRPSVSCIMPTHNRRQFVPRAIDCFIRQDYLSAELLILDDGNDRVIDLIPGGARIRYLHKSEKLTIGAKRNFACENVGGEIVVHWDDDDYYPPHRIRVQVEAMIESGADVTGSSGLYYLDAATGNAFLYQYEGGLRRWVAGNTLAYRRALWEHNRFPDVRVQEDLCFIWNARDALVLDLKDPSLCVASIHSANVSLKNPAGAYWNPVPRERVLAIMGDGAAACGHEVSKLNAL